MFFGCVVLGSCQGGRQSSPPLLGGLASCAGSLGQATRLLNADGCCCQRPRTQGNCKLMKWTLLTIVCLANVFVFRMTPPWELHGTSCDDVGENLLLWQVRAAAASAVAALLEGAPQRAYLGIAECRLPAKQPVRCMRLLTHLSHLLLLYQHT